MTSCYRCNADLPKGVPITRISVKMGKSSNVSWGRRLRTSSRSSYSEKPFCQACAAMMSSSSSSGITPAGCLGVVVVTVGFLGVVAAVIPKHSEPAPAVVVEQPRREPDMAVAVSPKRKAKRARPATPSAPKADDELMELR